MPALMFILSVMFACQTARPVVNEGITGYIYELKGNQMPAIGKPVSKGKGVSRQLYIYQAVEAGDAVGNAPFFTRVNAKLITHIKSDATGHYTVKLPVGQYSVFMKDGDRLFASETDGGYINLVIVKKGMMTNRDFKLTGEAAF